MPICPKCSKPVYFAEWKHSLGKHWHPACLKCELCGKTLISSRHSEHGGKPYCDVPCYSALFGPGGFGRGGTESHKKFGNMVTDRRRETHKNEVIRRIKLYNTGITSSRLLINHSEANYEVFFEGILHVLWRVKKPIRLCEKHYIDAKNFITVTAMEHRYSKNIDSSPLSSDKSNNARNELQKTGIDSPIISHTKIKRSGHNIMRLPTQQHKQYKQYRLQTKYNSEMFTPDSTFSTNVFIHNKVSSHNVISQILKKYQIDNEPEDFVLSVMYSNGGIRVLDKDDKILQIRINLGPSEDYAKICIMHSEDQQDIGLSFQAAQYAGLTLDQLEFCLEDITSEERDQEEMIREKFKTIKDLIEDLILQAE